MFDKLTKRQKEKLAAMLVQSAAELNQARRRLVREMEASRVPSVRLRKWIAIEDNKATRREVIDLIHSLYEAMA